MTLYIYLTLKILHFVRFYFELKEKINFNAFFKNPFSVQPLEEAEGPHESLDAIKDVKVNFFYIN